MNAASPSTPVSRPRRFWHALGVHRWRTVLDTGLHLYQSCDICKARRIVTFRNRYVHQPCDRQWVDTGEFRVMRPPRPTPKPPPRPDQVGPAPVTRREVIE